MMMKFSKFSEDIKEALVQFCIEQDEAVNGDFREEEITNLVESTFAVLDRTSGAEIDVTPIGRYYINAGETYSDEIYPYEVMENSMMYERIIRLGIFLLDGYCMNDTGTSEIMRGYEVVYDVDSEMIRLLYFIHTSDEKTFTFYRVDADYYENFDVYEFVIDLFRQMDARLRDSVRNERGAA